MSKQNDDIKKQNRRMRDKANREAKKQYNNAFLATITQALDNEAFKANKAIEISQSAENEKQKQDAEKIKFTAEQREKHIKNYVGLNEKETNALKALDVSESIANELALDAKSSEKAVALFKALATKDKNAFIEECEKGYNVSGFMIKFMLADEVIDPEIMAQWCINKTNGEPSKRQSDMMRKVLERLDVITFVKTGQKITSININKKNKIKMRLDKLFE